MGVFDTIADAMAGKSVGANGPGGPSNTKFGSNAAMTQLQSSRAEMMQKLKTLGLTAMPPGGEAQLDALWASHIRKYGPAVSTLRDSQ